MVKQKLIGRGLLTVIILVLMATIVYDQIKLHRKPVEYHFDIQTEDFAINNINLLSTPNHVYSAGGYFLELTGGDPFYRSDLNLIDNGAVFGGIHLTNKSVLHMKITYTLNGKNKEYSEDILLKDKVKPFRSIGEDGYKIYEIRPRETPLPR